MYNPELLLGLCPAHWILVLLIHKKLSHNCSTCTRAYLTLTPKIILFLQQEVSILAGVTWMPARVGLAVALSTFLDKQITQRKIDLQGRGWAMQSRPLAVDTNRNTDCLTSVENRRSRCWKFSPVRTLRHRSESLSDRTDTLAGDRDREGEWGHAYEYNSADLHWIDSDYRILQLTFGVKHKNTKTLQSSDICTSKVRRSYSLCPTQLKKKNTFP